MPEHTAGQCVGCGQKCSRDRLCDCCDRHVP
jgi:hypothetical protein